MTSIYSSQFVHRIKLVMDPSPWPMSLVCAINAFIVGMVSSCHLYYSLINFLILGFILFLLVFSLGIRDLLRDFLLRYEVIPVLMESFRNAFILFIISEVMFFLAFFGAFFHSSLAPTIQIVLCGRHYQLQYLILGACLWLILLFCGRQVQPQHGSICFNCGGRGTSHLCFIMTLLLSVLFLELQVYEYVHASFGISDGIYGSVFYLLTVFMGFMC